MARRLLGILTVSMIATGCASGTNTATLPKPTFTGPVVTQAPYVPPTPMAVRTPPRQTAIVPRGNVPAAWIPLGTAEKREWKWIVIHHSATPTGGAAAFDKAHKAKGWDGLGYDFVIGNGTDTADGKIEVGYRWPIQTHGAHAKTPDNQYNEHGIGICLVGNLSETRPTPKQLASLQKLVAYLADTYKIKQSNILGHKQTGKSTECPGTFMNIQQVRADVARQRRMTLAADATIETNDETVELMQTAAR